MLLIQERYHVVVAAADGNDPHPRVAATTKAAAAIAKLATIHRKPGTLDTDETTNAAAAAVTMTTTTLRTTTTTRLQYDTIIRGCGLV